MNKLIKERFQRVWDRFTALDREAKESKAVFEAYREVNNNSRGALSDLASRLLPKEEYQVHHDALVERVNNLDTRVLQNTALQTGRSAGISTVGYIAVCLISSVGVIAAIVISLLH